MTHPSVHKFEFDFSKALYKVNTRWINLTLHCECTRDRGIIDIELTHQGQYIPWLFVALIDKELCEEIKTAAQQHYEGLLEEQDDALEMNLID